MARKRNASKSDDGVAIHRPKKKGMGIGLKFALPISLIITLLFAILGWSVHSQTKQGLETSIDSAGVFAAKALAAPDWHNPDNVKRLRSLLSDRVVEVAIFEFGETRPGQKTELKLVASATGAQSFKATKRPSHTLGDVSVDRGTIELEGGRKVPFRSFYSTIKRPGSETQEIAAVRVYLSEESLESELASLLQKIILFSIIGIVLGVGAAFLLAKAITKPIQSLVQDLRAVAGGNLGHRTRVRSSDEIGALAHAFDEMTRGLEEGQQAKADLSSKEHQEQITQEIQEKLFPQELPKLDGISVDASFVSADDISSDLFDFVRIDDDHEGLLLLSASGRGVPAAVVLAMARSVFRSVATGLKDPAEALRRINALFSPDLRRGMYVTAIYAVVNAKAKTVHLASAGHKLPALQLRASDDAFLRHHPSGIAMGLDAGPVFDRSLECEEIQLGKGDAMLLGTAGLLSLTLESGEELGEARFFKAAHRVLADGQDDPAQLLVARIQANLADDPGEHDITVVGLRVKA